MEQEGGGKQQQQQQRPQYMHVSGGHPEFLLEHTHTLKAWYMGCFFATYRLTYSSCRGLFANMYVVGTSMSIPIWVY